MFGIPLKTDTKPKELAKEKGLTKQQKYRMKRDAMISNHVIASPVVIDLNEKRFFTVRFICGHQNTFIDPAPVPSDIVLCRKCDDYQEVIRANQWSYKRPERM